MCRKNHDSMIVDELLRSVEPPPPAVPPYFVDLADLDALETCFPWISCPRLARFLAGPVPLALPDDLGRVEREHAARVADGVALLESMVAAKKIPSRAVNGEALVPMRACVDCLGKTACPDWMPSHVHRLCKETKVTDSPTEIQRLEAQKRAVKRLAPLESFNLPRETVEKRIKDSFAQALKRGVIQSSGSGKSRMVDAVSFEKWLDSRVAKKTD